MPSTDAASKPKPRVWVLLGEGAGGNAQMCQLADALGWPYTAKQMRYNFLNHLPNPLLGPTAITVKKRESDALMPPWPDLVIAASRRAAPLARWIKKRSGGRTRLVHLLHTQAPLHHFDLVVTLPQYRLPERANILHNTLPLNTLDAEKLQTAAAHWAPKLAHLPRPWVALLVGGNSSSYRLDSDTATRLGEQASNTAQSQGGSLLVTTSPRTPADATQALEQAIECAAHIYRWQPGAEDNPYLAYLALADSFIVTADSASLPAEACATGRPVTLFDWRPRSTSDRSERRLLAKRLTAALIYWGFIKPKRDFSAFHRSLEDQGLVGQETKQGQRPSQALNDMQRTVDRIIKLF